MPSNGMPSTATGLQMMYDAQMSRARRRIQAINDKLIITPLMNRLVDMVQGDAKRKLLKEYHQCINAEQYARLKARVCFTGLNQFHVYGKGIVAAKRALMVHS